MNIETITMEPKEALEKLKLYRKKLQQKKRSQVEKHVTQEYKTACKVLRELGKGHPILDIEDVIRNAPIDNKERPRLAICRADLKQVRFRWGANSERASFTGFFDTGFWSSARDIRIQLNMERTHHYTCVPGWSKDGKARPWELEGYSLVPLVPPNIDLKAKLESHHILWEVEKWSDTEIGAKPDKDPYLLRRLNNTLFAVVAEWDLTEVEQLVMKRRIDL